MRDLHDELSRATMLDLTGQDRPVPPLGRSVAAISGSPAIHTHAGASEAAQRASEKDFQHREVSYAFTKTSNGQVVGDFVYTTPRPRHIRAAEIGSEIIESDGRFIRQAVTQIYDAAIEIAASAGPLPLAMHPEDLLAWLKGAGDDGGSPAWHRAVLDASAALYPDLVPATTMQGEP
jgi:hypothetical protein